MHKRHIIHVASELAPIAKVGGLGDVVHGLAKETIRLGAKVEVILPKYDSLPLDKVENLKKEKPTIWSGKVDGIDTLFFESPHFQRGFIYGAPDDAERFLDFSRAVVEYLKTRKEIDIIHLHDWHTAIIALLYKKNSPKTVLTLHTVEHQGKSSGEFPNLLKAGVEAADKLVAVSPTFEKEIQTPLGGFGLDSVFRKRKNDLVGILNGIDETVWNGEKDPHLAAKLSPKNLKKGKAANKKALQTLLGLKNENVPLVASVSRLASQKAPHLIIHAIKRTLEKGGQFVLLGAGSPEELCPFRELFPHPNLSLNLAYSETLAHLIFAGADMFVIPSLFEPCGLTQMIALHYGTIPIARKTGGLADTVFDEKNGFTFEFPDPQGVDWALNRAFACYQNTPDTWLSLMKEGLSTDFSWKKPALAYNNLYSQLQK